MKVHILGICGTFMGSLAILAAKAGMQVSGQDAKVYPPMSTQLTEQGIALTDGYEIADLPTDIDLLVIGNVMKRGLPIVEHVLNAKMPFMSGPEFLEKYILRDQHVLVVTGTHGKTTTTSILTWILHYAGLNPGYLIGGVPNNFGVSADIGAGQYFVVEGDEYDCAFFDKRSKFIHYKPQTLILNNIEFDHADIFKDLDAILTQFNHLMRIVPGAGLVVYREDDLNVRRVLDNGCWSNKIAFSSKDTQIPLPATLLGEHNRLNALAAIAAAQNVGVPRDVAIKALQEFAGVKRRLEVKGEAGGVSVYSDFAHHPTAITVTLAAIREAIANDRRIIAVVDICSNTMRAGVHKDTLGSAVSAADIAYFFHGPDVKWDVQKTWQDSSKPGGVFSDHASLLANMLPQIKAGDLVLLMSNGAFEGFAQTLLEQLAACNVQ
ncbi:MAG TPA: Mur ligase family protein, partial [Gammaproteobacteria bacterium]|nr:Mur ligase family protein [Gammaproteobacteria bacterium]